MDIKKIILETIKDKKSIKSSDIIKMTGFSRNYINRFLQELRNEGKIILIGKANRSRYILAEKNNLIEAKKNILDTRKILINKNLSEDTILSQIKSESGIFIDLEDNVMRILDYAFTEILNNAIEHSKSKKIEIRIRREENLITFNITDRGIGIFNNIINKKNLKNELEAIQDLLKGKQTTLPEYHSGEGIFFTSKMADIFIISGSNKKLIFNNNLEDIFIQDIKKITGTKVIFTISIHTKKESNEIFKEYSGESFEFNKTKVAVRLYKMGALYVSRSQARRITSGLDKFKLVVLDFNHIKNVGQAFTDEIFRVWKNKHPDIKITTQNLNDNIEFMIKRVTE